MRALPILAAILCTTPLAGAKSELELLQDRCAEQERQIRQLEIENNRLKQISGSATRTAPAMGHNSAANRKTISSPTYGMVRSGDTLSKLAKRHGTTTKELVKLNNLANPSLIRPGQKIRLPDPQAASAPSATSHTAARSTATGTHTVKTGDTFYSIARRYGLSPHALQAANPSAKAESLRPGQTLILGGGKNTTASRHDIDKQVTRKLASTSKPSRKTADVPQRSDSKKAEPTPATEPSVQTISNTPRIRLIKLNQDTKFGDFAAAHGTTTAKLNALNGHNLNASQVLAKDSELHVPAQP